MGPGHPCNLHHHPKKQKKRTRYPTLLLPASMINDEYKFIDFSTTDYKYKL